MRSQIAWSALVAGTAALDVSQVFPLTPNLIPLQQNAGSDKLFPMADCFGFQLHEATIDQMQTAMARGNLTSVQLVSCYMTRQFQTQQYLK
jgi:amidase